MQFGRTIGNNEYVHKVTGKNYVYKESKHFTWGNQNVWFGVKSETKTKIQTKSANAFFHPKIMPHALYMYKY